jgi:hypothetical protein
MEAVKVLVDLGLTAVLVYILFRLLAIMETRLLSLEKAINNLKDTLLYYCGHSLQEQRPVIKIRRRRKYVE